MPFFACDEDDRVISAVNAQKGEIYHCLECFLPVKARRHNTLSVHFYHIRSSPQCRLYSKTEDHLLAQLQLQKLFPENAIQLERPFRELSRIADACWEEKKIVFEIQCSHLEIPEAEARINDYFGKGYRVVWLLHDRLFNRQTVRPVESFLRQFATYYIRIQRGATSTYYDQFEVLAHGKRMKKGKKLLIDLQAPRRLPEKKWQDFFPKQVLARVERGPLYFRGDRLYKALQAFEFPMAAINMEHWRLLEVNLSKRPKKISRLRNLFLRYIGYPYVRLLIRLGTK